MKHFLSNVLALANALLIVALAGCGEGENTYEYRVKNCTDAEVCIEYSVVSSPKIERDTLQPNEVVCLFVRENVTGDGIWDVESGSDVYSVTKLSAAIKDSIFTEDLRLRRLWDGPEPEDETGVGVYCLSVRDSLFVMSKKIYVYELKNNTSREILFNLSGSCVEEQTVSIAAGELKELAVCDETAKYVNGLSSRKIDILGLKYIVDADTIEVSGYNANDAAKWSLSYDLTGADSVGVYSQTLEESIFDNGFEE